MYSSGCFIWLDNFETEGPGSFRPCLSCCSLTHFFFFFKIVISWEWWERPNGESQQCIMCLSLPYSIKITTFLQHSCQMSIFSPAGQISLSTGWALREWEGAKSLSRRSVGLVTRFLACPLWITAVLLRGSYSPKTKIELLEKEQRGSTFQKQVISEYLKKEKLRT